MSIKSVMPSNHLIFCWPFSSCLQSFPASVFSNELALCIRCTKHWSFSISPSNECSGLISFRIDFRISFRISLQSKGLSRVFSNTTVQKHQFFSTQPFLWSNSHICTRLLEGPSFNFMAEVTICSNFGAQKIKSVTVSTFPPFYLS